MEELAAEMSKRGIRQSSSRVFKYEVDDVVWKLQDGQIMQRQWIKTYWWQKDGCVCATHTRFALVILRLIAKHCIEGPEFCFPKLCDMCSIRVEHKSSNSARQLAATFWGRGLQLSVSILKCPWSAYITVDLFRVFFIPWSFPALFKWMPVEVSCFSRRESLNEEARKRLMVEAPDGEYTCSDCCQFLVGRQIR